MSWRLLNIKDEVEEAYGKKFDLGGPFEGYKNMSQGMEMASDHL